MRKFKFLVSLLLPFIFVTSVFSNNTEGTNSILIDKQVAVTNCTLPAPTGLNVINVTANSITVVWNPVAGAIGYEVTSFDVSTGLPLTAPIQASVASAVVTPLPPNTLVEIRVAAICENEEVSLNRGTIQEYTNIVIELVVGGYECSPSNWTTIDFDGLQGNTVEITTYYNQSYVWVLEQKGKEQLTSKYDLNAPSGTGRADMGPISTALGVLSETGTGGATFVTNNGGNTVCNFVMYSGNTNDITLAISQPAAGYLFKIGACAPPPPPGKDMNGGNPGNLEDRSGVEYHKQAALSITPNPFTNQLTIQFPDDNENDGLATAAIYHLNGMLAKSETIEAASGKTLTMNTSDLPAGMYLLRTETVTGVTTKLVMKAE